MMMSPLNILSNTASDSVTAASSAISRSPESVCSAKSLSPPVNLPSGPLAPSSLMPGAKDSSAAAAAAAAASAASLIHAFASANPQLANPSALAQMFPGFPLHMAAAFAGYANQSGNSHQTAAAVGQHAPNPYGALYAQVQQQQLSSLISQAARQHQFMAMQSGKKLVDFDPTFPTPPPTSKLSPTSMHPPAPPSHHHLQGHSPTSNGLYSRNPGGQTVGQVHSNPLMPLTMMAKGQSSPNGGANGPHSSSNNNSSNSSSGSAGLLSPILFSPLSASSVSDVAYKRKLGLLAGPNEASDVPNSNTAGNSDSAFSMANFQRMARQSPGSSAAGNLNGAFVCPICNESLDGVDLNAHFYEELHKIDSLRKMAVWGGDEEVKKEISPYEKFGTSYSVAAGSGTSSSYQKKLQLPQSRWETFQRIRQNRHQRLSAFMRFTRRKYETAYESIAAAAAASQHSPLGAPNASHLPPPPPPAQAHQGQPQLGGPGSAVPGQQHFHHHSPSSSSTSSSSATTTHRSPSTMATSTISPHHPSHGGHFEHHGAVSFNGGLKVSPGGVAEAHGEMPRSSPASLLAPPGSSAAHYPSAHHHPMFAQNPAAFLHPGLPFYQSAYHAAAAAAAAAQLQQSSPTAATGPWSMGAGSYAGGFPSAGDHFVSAGFAANSSVPNAAATAANGAPKIWRSVDTEQLEAALSTTSEDGVECSGNKKLTEAEAGKAKMMKKEEADHSESIDVCSELANQQHNSRCSSNVSQSSHGGEEEGGARCEDDSNDRHTPAVTAVSEDSNHSQSLKACKDTEGEGGEQDDLMSNHSSRGAEHSEAEEEENRASEGEEEDDVDVVSSDSEANHVPAKARSQKRPSSPFDSPTYPSKHRFSHGALYHHNHHNHNHSHHHHSSHRHHSSDSFHFSHSLVARSDSVSSGTETTPVS